MSEFDLGSIEKIIELTGNGARTGGAIADLASKLQTMIKSPKKASDDDFLAVINDLRSQVADAKMTNLDLREEVIALRETILETQARKTEFDRYELWETPAGTVVYQLKETAQNEEPHHYLCPRCKEDGIKSILQGHDEYRECPVCPEGSKGYRFKRTSPIHVVGRRSSGWDDFI